MRFGVGLTAASYGAGAALTVAPIRAIFDAAGYEAAFFWFGLVQGGIVFILADLPHQERNLQPIPVNVHGHFWNQVCDRQPQSALHGERCVGFSGSGCQPHQVSDRRLALGIRIDGNHEFRSCSRRCGNGSWPFRHCNLLAVWEAVATRRRIKIHASCACR